MNDKRNTPPSCFKTRWNRKQFSEGVTHETCKFVVSDLLDFGGRLGEMTDKGVRKST